MPSLEYGRSNMYHKAAASVNLPHYFVVNNCVCQRNGNKYIQLAEHECAKFTQYDNITGITHTHSCPEGLRFSVETCVCEHSQAVLCEGCGPLGRQLS